MTERKISDFIHNGKHDHDKYLLSFWETNQFGRCHSASLHTNYRACILRTFVMDTTDAFMSYKVY